MTAASAEGFRVETATGMDHGVRVEQDGSEVLVNVPKDDELGDGSVDCIVLLDYENDAETVKERLESEVDGYGDPATLVVPDTFPEFDTTRQAGNAMALADAIDDYDGEVERLERGELYDQPVGDSALRLQQLGFQPTNEFGSKAVVSLVSEAQNEDIGVTVTGRLDLASRGNLDGLFDDRAEQFAATYAQYNGEHPAETDVSVVDVPRTELGQDAPFLEEWEPDLALLSGGDLTHGTVQAAADADADLVSLPTAGSRAVGADGGRTVLRGVPPEEVPEDLEPDGRRVLRLTGGYETTVDDYEMTGQRNGVQEFDPRKPVDTLQPRPGELQVTAVDGTGDDLAALVEHEGVSIGVSTSGEHADRLAEYARGDLDAFVGLTEDAVGSRAPEVADVTFAPGQDGEGLGNTNIETTEGLTVQGHVSGVGEKDARVEVEAAGSSALLIGPVDYTYWFDTGDDAHDLMLVDGNADGSKLNDDLDTTTAVHCFEDDEQEYGLVSRYLHPDGDGHDPMEPSVPTGDDRTGDVCFRLDEGGLGARLDLDSGVAPPRLTGQFGDREGDAPWRVTLVPDDPQEEAETMEGGESVVDKAQRNIVDRVFRRDRGQKR